MDIWQILMTPFSWILKQFIILFDSYGIALMLFTIVIKIVLFPFSLKSKKSMIQMNILSGAQREIQRRWPNDRAKQQEELQKLYLKHNVNPMGGCMWSLIPMFVLFPLYAVIRRPFKYLMGLTETATAAVATALGMTDFSAANGMSELVLSSLLNDSNLELAKQAANSTKLFVINFNFFGVDLSQIPNWKFWVNGITWGSIGLALLPVISAVLSLVSSFVMQKTNSMNKGKDQPAPSSNASMYIMMPIMSLWIGFTLPAGLCVYWISNSIFSMLQEIIAGRMLKKDYEEAQRKMAEDAEREKAEEKERRRLAAERKAAALADKKSGKKKAVKKESEGPSINKEDSRVGMRTYARGRAYDPNRYPSFPYRDPNSSNPAEDSEDIVEEEEVLLTEQETSADVAAANAEPDVPAQPEAADSADYEAPYEEDPESDENENKE